MNLIGTKCTLPRICHVLLITVDSRHSLQSFLFSLCFSKMTSFMYRTLAYSNCTNSLKIGSHNLLVLVNEVCTKKFVLILHDVIAKSMYIFLHIFIVSFVPLHISVLRTLEYPCHQCLPFPAHGL